MTTAQTAAPIQRKPLRLWPGLAAVALQSAAVAHRPAHHRLGHDGRGLRRRPPRYGGAGVVVVLQPRPLARTDRRHRPDGCGDRRYLPRRSPIDLERDDGRDAARLLLPPLCLALVAWAAASRGLSTVPRWAALVVGDRSRVWSDDAAADRRHRRGQPCGSSLEMDRHSRGAAARCRR